MESSKRVVVKRRSIRGYQGSKVCSNRRDTVARKKTKIVMSASTKKIAHHPSSKHVVMKGMKGGKKRAKKVMVKV